jgi:hypothetical protein
MPFGVTRINPRDIVFSAMNGPNPLRRIVQHGLTG